MVRTTWRESLAGPPRKYYTLTAAGRRRLAAMTGQFGEVTRAVEAILKGVER